MLEGLRKVMERMSELNDRFRSLRPNSTRSEAKSFESILNARRKPLAGAPQPIISPISAFSQANPTPPDFSDLIRLYSAKHSVNPELVKRLIEVESNFDPNCVSKRGAMGLMQLMPQTARDLGVINPFDPEENISGGTRYLASMIKNNGGNIAQALASYNAGPGAVRRFGGIPPFAETQNYIKKILGSLETNSSNNLLVKKEEKFK